MSDVTAIQNLRGGVELTPVRFWAYPQKVFCEVIVEALGKHWSLSESMGLEMNQPLGTALG